MGLDDISGDDSSLSTIVQISSPSTTVNKIRSFAPQIGLSGGGGLVQITADGIGFGGVYTCTFGDKNVIGIVTKLNSLSCLTPPNKPSNVSLSIRNDNGDIWCCGFYVYYPLLGALSISPPMVLSAGGPIIIQFYSNLPNIKLYCYFGGLYMTPANIVSNQSVSCVSPVIGNASVLVGVGRTFFLFL